RCGWRDRSPAWASRHGRARPVSISASRRTLANGRISLNANGLNNTLIDNRSSHSLVFRDKGAQQFKVANMQGSNAAFSLDTPGYGFDLELLPVARARFDLDLGIKKLSRTLGPYSLGALALTVGGFGMGHHDGTVSSHV